MKSFLVILSCLLFVASPAFAQSLTLANQVSVSPSIIHLDLATDQPQAQLTYTNHTNSSVSLSFQAQNFTELEDSYKLSFLSPKDAQNYKYGLSSWVQFSSKTLLLDPGESQSITVFIEKNKLSPGAHYATILAEINPDEKTGQTIQVKGILGSLLFVRTNTGKEDESATLPTFDINRNLFDFPGSPYFRFDNTGDTDLTPYGLLQIQTTTGSLVAKGIVNDTSAPTIPESIRRYYVPTEKLQTFLFPGMYTATLSLHFGKSQQKIIKTITFFSQGSVPIIPIGVVIIIGLVIWLLKRSKQHIADTK